MVTPIRIYSGTNLDRLYREYAEFLKERGLPIEFGNPAEPKQARHSMAVIQLYGRAIEDILAGKVPRDFPWQGEKIKALQDSFDKDAKNDRYLAACNPEDKVHFDYTYPELLTKQVYHDPLSPYDVEWQDLMNAASTQLKRAIKHNLFDTRNVGNVYEPFFTHVENKPCFNWFQVQHTGDGKVTLVLVFRSHDYGGAIWANVCSISYWFNERVILPAGGQLDEVIIFSASAHVYKDSDIIERLTRHGPMGRFI